MYKGLRLGATGRTRTDDLLITNELLYQLSHSSVCATLSTTDILIYFEKKSNSFVKKS